MFDAFNDMFWYFNDTVTSVFRFNRQRIRDAEIRSAIMLNYCYRECKCAFIVEEMLNLGILTD